MNDPRTFDLRNEGARRRDSSLMMLETLRPRVLLMARRVMLGVLLQRGEATADDVFGGVSLPPGMNAVALGAVPGPLARAGIIARTGRTVQSSRPQRHACDIRVWELRDREAAEQWLRANPDMPLADRRPLHQRLFVWSANETSPAGNPTGPVPDSVI